MKYVQGFFAFWYDFIVGDAWEVAAGAVGSLIVLWVVLQATGGAANLALVVLLPLAIIVLLGYSLWRARSSV